MGWRSFIAVIIVAFDWSQSQRGLCEPACRNAIELDYVLCGICALILKRINFVTTVRKLDDMCGANEPNL